MSVPVPAIRFAPGRPAAHGHPTLVVVRWRGLALEKRRNLLKHKGAFAYPERVNEIDDLVLSRTHLVVRAANALHGSVRHRIEWRDLYQSGAVGLIRSAQKFNPDRGVPFRRVCLPQDPASHDPLDPKSSGPEPWGPRVSQQDDADPGNRGQENEGPAVDGKNPETLGTSKSNEALSLDEYPELTSTRPARVLLEEWAMWPAPIQVKRCWGWLAGCS